MRMVRNRFRNRPGEPDCDLDSCSAWNQSREERLVAQLKQLKSELLSDGKISSNEVARIRRYVEEDGALDFDDVAFLVELIGEANEVCPEFDELFLPLMRHVLLKDGKIDLEEQTILVDMLVAGGAIRQSEIKLVRDLQIEATETTPGFDKLCQALLAIPAS